MTDSKKLVEFDGDGNEVVGSLKIVKVMHDDGADRPYHLEIDAEEHVLDELVRFGSESTGYIDFFSTGIRAGILERIARGREN
jgi:hypothetical protein